MKVIAAYLLAVLGDKTKPTADDIKNILASVGAEADEAKIELLLSQVEGKDITELIAAGRGKMASTTCLGGGAAVAAVGSAEAAAAPAAEAKKEEKEEIIEESDEEMCFSLFD